MSIKKLLDIVKIGQNMKHIGAQKTFVNKITKVLMNFLSKTFLVKGRAP